MAVQGRKTYLGDGVYAELDGGFQIRLSTVRSEGEHEIFLESAAMDALIEFYNLLKQGPEA